MAIGHSPLRIYGAQSLPSLWPHSQSDAAFWVLSLYDLTPQQSNEVLQLFGEKAKQAPPHATSTPWVTLRATRKGVLHVQAQSLAKVLHCSPSQITFDQVVLGAQNITESLAQDLRVAWCEPAIEELWQGSWPEYEKLRQTRSQVSLRTDDSWDHKTAAEWDLEFSAAELQAIAMEEKNRERRMNRAELEVIAQTWSEHCKHKIFSARIRAKDARQEVTEGLFKTHLRSPTLEIQKNKPDTYLSVFHDNAGVLKLFNPDGAATPWAFCAKMETHNSPSAISPYGGATTGLVGVFRDILGTGLGAWPFASWDVLCFESPQHNKARPAKSLPAALIRSGVLKGIEDGGNQSGIPTVQGSVVFDPSYSAKPLVYAGALGLLRVDQVDKKPKPGLKLYCVGGPVGPDGLRGAVMSSRDLRAEDFSGSAVQVAQAFVQRCMAEFLMQARDVGLIDSVTDNGAGGLASSVGEMARSTGGARIDLSGVRLKFAGLLGWERLCPKAKSA